MISQTAAVGTALLTVALLVVAVGISGGWRRERSDPVPAVVSFAPPKRATSDNPGAQAFALRWRARWVTIVTRTILLIAIGLTPLGARFIHLLAPSDGSWQVAAAWMIVLAVFLAAGLPARGLRLRARRALAGLNGPRPSRRRLALGMALMTVDIALSFVLLASALRSDAGPLAIGGAIGGAMGFLLLPFARNPVRRLPASERLTAGLESLDRPGMRRPPLLAEGWLPNRPANAVALGFLPRPMILFAPPLADALSDRQLRATVGHELAHLLHHDVIQRRLRLYLTAVAAGATALALNGLPAVRGLAGLAGNLSGQSIPFLLAIGYMAHRVLFAVHLRACRAEERRADIRMLQLTGDLDGCVTSLGLLQSMLGTPDRWTLAQRLLVATHPAKEERQRLLHCAAITPTSIPELSASS